MYIYISVCVDIYLCLYIYPYIFIDVSFYKCTHVALSLGISIYIAASAYIDTHIR